MDEQLLKRLQSVDTPTVCNAIEVAQGKRGFAAFTHGTLLCSAPEEPPIVGYARTARIAPAPIGGKSTPRCTRGSVSLVPSPIASCVI